MPPSWVVWSIFLAIRFRLAEIAVPPGTALIEKLAALAPGTTDALLRRATGRGPTGCVGAAAPPLESALPALPNPRLPMTFQNLTIERDGGVALLWLDRPEKLNALHARCGTRSPRPWHTSTQTPRSEWSCSPGAAKPFAPAST